MQLRSKRTTGAYEMSYSVTRCFPGPETQHDVYVSITKAAPHRSPAIRHDLVKRFGRFTAAARAAVRALGIPEREWSAPRISAAVARHHFPCVIAFRDDVRTAQLILRAKGASGAWTADEVCKTVEYVMEFVGYAVHEVTAVELHDVMGLRTILTAWVLDEAYRGKEQDVETLAAVMAGVEDAVFDDAATSLPVDISRLRMALWELRGRPPGGMLPVT
jgi:hypothetical protein